MHITLPKVITQLNLKNKKEMNLGCRAGCRGIAPGPFAPAASGLATELQRPLH